MDKIQDPAGNGTHTDLDRGIPADLAERRFATMCLIREFEKSLLDLFAQGRIGGTTHTCLGQEADAVAVMENLLPGDWVFSNHRCHGHYLARFDDPQGLLAEILGLESGICRGVGGSQHLQRDRFFSNGIQGGIVPCAAGLALGSRISGTSDIAVAFLGDGTLGEGVVYETLNIASLWNLPLLLVVEDNGWAQSTPSSRGVSGSIAARASAFGIESAEIRSTDVEALARAAKDAIDRVRGTSRPFWLVIRTFRAGPHSKGDDTRTPEELSAASMPDPIDLLSARLPGPTRDAIKDEVSRRIGRATAALVAEAP